MKMSLVKEGDEKILEGERERELMKLFENT